MRHCVLRNHSYDTHIIQYYTMFAQKWQFYDIAPQTNDIYTQFEMSSYVPDSNSLLSPMRKDTSFWLTVETVRFNDEFPSTTRGD